MLINFLKRNENTRKIFGKRELVIIDKQLNGINLTQSEKNRLSRDIRPKFKFIKECAEFSKEFDLEKGSEIKTIIQNIIKDVKEDSLFKKVKRIILFGSTVERQRTFRSDIDIAVEFDMVTKKEAFRFRRRVLGYYDESVDIQVYNVLPDKIKNEIDLKGRVLYERS
ncbi:MAG: nucleotidyltransferase domain-containing protein [Nanoarchaeota archaeon]